MAADQHLPSDMMISTPDYWARLAEYLLLYDQIIIPTGNMQILAVLRIMLGDNIFDELIRNKIIVLARYDMWFGYLGAGGIGFYQVFDNPEMQKNSFPNMATNHFEHLDQAIENALIATNPPSTTKRKTVIKNLLLDNTIVLPMETIFKGVKEEAFSDIRNSSYLQNILSLKNADCLIGNIGKSNPNSFTIFNPHVTPKKVIPEIEALNRVVFENLLLSIGGHTQATALTGDNSTLSVLNAKGQRIGFSPQGRKAFADLQKINGVPDIGLAFSSKQLSAAQIFDLRSSEHAADLRIWLDKGSPTEEATETIARYIETIKNPSLVERWPVKILRFAITATWSTLEPVTGIAATAIDNFYLKKLYSHKSPDLFMRQAKIVLTNTPVIHPPIRKGRDRNAVCSCGSGKKYKTCCGI
ncbi:SEC-C metal-binding domain-containing protein [Nitrosomonas sp. Is79A3]|uniref:SEC-C metal-binding domain-containing protein n=1 Tax=Nitrosomonas sp. (strain Is79A3) TaxID=261292 RepID=UPI0018DE754E